MQVHIPVCAQYQLRYLMCPRTLVTYRSVDLPADYPGGYEDTATHLQQLTRVECHDNGRCVETHTYFIIHTQPGEYRNRGYKLSSCLIWREWFVNDVATATYTQGYWVPKPARHGVFVMLLEVALHNVGARALVWVQKPKAYLNAQRWDV